MRKVLKALFIRRSEERVTKYFRELTGKKYILLTNSCRAALYLAYKSLKKIKTVITSPLTCTIALSPIIESGKELYYCDIDEKTLVIDTTLLLENVGNDVVVQVIHFGGYPVDVQEIKKKGYMVVEDCAQALGSKRNHRSVGYFGDIACFSLTKMGYGIGGGILATNDEELYSAAKLEQDTWIRFDRVKLLFRILRGWLETNLRNRLFRFALIKVLTLTDNKRYLGKVDFAGNLKKPISFLFKIFSVQLKHLNRYHEIRKKKNEDIYLMIDSKKWKKQFFQDGNGTKMVIGKLFFYHPSIRTDKLMPLMLDNGIESKHLEQRADSCIQIRLDKDPRFNKNLKKENLQNYLRIHDHLISLPLNEDLKKHEIDQIAKTLNYSDR